MLAALFAAPKGHAEEAQASTSRPNPRPLALAEEVETFSFIVFGDRTDGLPSGLEVLSRAIDETNLLGPDLVMTVGDQVQGYNTRAEWMEQMQAYKNRMSQLDAPWFPVPGNHDIYWRGSGGSEEEHEGDFEHHFAPLWYAFEHKNCLFLVLYSDEGNPATGKRSFKDPASQTMSEQQLTWLRETLEDGRDARHVFVFLHHPRWFKNRIGWSRYGDDWDRVHRVLRNAGNVRAVFGGHIARMHYAGVIDGIEYFTLAVTGGKMDKDNREGGYLHHIFHVKVRPDDVHVAAIPVGVVMDPREYPRSYPDFDYRTEILPVTRFKIRSDRRRVLRYNFTLPEIVTENALLQIGIGKSNDDSGDKGLYYKLYDQNDRVVREDFISRKAVYWISLPVETGTRWTLAIEDQDTALDGPLPGNAGTVQVRLRH